MQAIDNILSDGKADDYDLEEVHEISYSLEAAIDFILQESLNEKQKMQATYIDKEVQNIHYSSEEHNLEKTIFYFKRLETAFNQFIS